MATRSNFPIPKFLFTVEFDGKGGEIPFQEVTGLDQEYDFLEYRSGADDDLSTRKRAGLYKSGQVTFKKGLFKSDSALLDAFIPLRDGKAKDYRAETKPFDITVTLKDESNTPVWIWKILGAIPVKLTNGDLKSDENAIAIEQLDCVFSRIDSEKV